MDVLLSSAVLVETVEGCMEDNGDGVGVGSGNLGSLSTLSEYSSERDCGGSSCDLVGKSGTRLHIRPITWSNQSVLRSFQSSVLTRLTAEL